MLKEFYIFIFLLLIVKNTIESYRQFNQLSRNKSIKILDNNLEPEQIQMFDYNKIEDDILLFDNPNPWIKIIIKADKKIPNEFYTIVDSLKLDKYVKWKSILPNIKLNIDTNEFIIYSFDEIDALIILNLMIMTFLNQISINEIIKTKLIENTRLKARKYESVQRRIREQIKLNTATFNTLDNSPKQVSEENEHPSNMITLSNSSLDFKQDLSRSPSSIINNSDNFI